MFHQVDAESTSRSRNAFTVTGGVIEFSHLLCPTESTGIAQSFRTKRTLCYVRPKHYNIQLERTLRHSGESVRPQVIQTYCSARCVFLSLLFLNDVNVCSSHNTPFSSLNLHRPRHQRWTVRRVGKLIPRRIRGHRQSLTM